MSRLFLLALLFSAPASADLYRWVDPQSGSVKFSSLPPPWYGDAARERVSPRVEVISVKPPAAIAPAAKPSAEKPAPPRPPST